ncbi:hypothetical protein VTH82DRAFT_1512 [Thermothelomyces myriococcoides]
MTTTASRIRLSPEHLGIARLEDVLVPGALEVADEILQKNHEEWHIYFRDIAGHNHIVHSVLTVLAMGGGPDQLRRAYNDGEVVQRPPPILAAESVDSLADPDVFLSRMVKISEYTNFLVFFEGEIDKKGWPAVVNEYLFTGTSVAEAMFSQLCEGLYHPLIHLGFGVEFHQPGIVAEGLAEAATQDPGLALADFYRRSEEFARSGAVSPKPLVELYKAVRDNTKIRAAARLEDGPRRSERIIERAVDELVPIACQFQVKSDNLERALAEVFSCSAFTAAAQKPGKKPKVDFFHLHFATSALAVDVLLRQDWISAENKARLIEWKARTDLVWYASNGAPEMCAEAIEQYQPTLSKGMGWKELYRAANELHDDGHVVKFMRSLKDGEELVRPFEQGPDAADFPVHGDMWLKTAQLCYDSSVGIVDVPFEPSKKWVFGAGFDLAWAEVPDIPQS